MTHHIKPAFAAFVLSLGCLAACAEPNLLVNPGFAGGTGGWADRTSKKQSVSAEPAKGLPGDVNALRVKVTQDGGSSHGQIIQTVNVRPGVAYKLSAKIKADKADMAYVQIKQMKGKSEGERISTGTNKKAGDWDTVEKEITTAADTTALQILLRFRMNAKLVGASALFALPTLVALDGGDVAPKPYEPPKPIALLVGKPGRDAYVSPTGAGRRDGADWDNAFAGNSDGLQKAWARAGAGNTVYLAAGDYGAAALTMDTGGASLEKPKRLVGVSKDGKRPTFTGTWTYKKPASGAPFVTIKPGVSFVEIDNIALRTVKEAIHMNGPNAGIRVRNIDVAECRDAFWINGGATAAFPENGSRDIVFEDSKVVRHTKRAMRIENGVNGFTAKNVFADAGGADYAHEVFPVGFHIVGNSSSKIPGVVDRNLTFINCEANNNWHNGGDKYWNADGFAAERNVSDLTFINCRAFGNTDGGWDVKSKRTKWIDCVGIANKRNFRVWSQPEADQPVFQNCLSAYSIDYGNKRHDVGFWLQGNGFHTLLNCTAWDDRVPISVESKEDAWQSVVTLKDSLIATLNANGTGIRLDGQVDFRNENSRIKTDGTTPFTLRAPVRAPGTVGNAFDCTSDPKLGYSSAKQLQ